MKPAPPQASDARPTHAAVADRAGAGADVATNAQGPRLRRTLLRLPDPAAWHAPFGADLAHAFARLPDIDGERLVMQLACAHDSARARPPTQAALWQALSHPLSADALARSRTQRFDAGRTPHETGICASSIAPLRAALAAADARDFVDVVEGIGRAAGNGTGLRTRAVTLRGDATGAELRFPHHRYVLPRLAELHGYLRRHLVREPLFTAVVAMIALTNLHPFLDANGRSSRILGNALLGIAHPRPLAYLPFYEFAWHAGHGWEIRVRLAELCADWRPVCTYMRDLIDIACALAPSRCGT